MGPEPFEVAQTHFNQKFKAKSGHTWDDRAEPPKKGKYTFLEKNYEDEEDEAVEEAQDQQENQVESQLPRQTQRLVELIFNQSHFNAVLEQLGYNANKLPLGKLSKATLQEGFNHLHELASLIKHPSLAGNKYDESQQEVRYPLAVGIEQVNDTLTRPSRLSRISRISITLRFLMNSGELVRPS